MDLKKTRGEKRTLNGFERRRLLKSVSAIVLSAAMILQGMPSGFSFQTKADPVTPAQGAGIYAVAENGTTSTADANARRIYEFYKGEELLGTQYVRKADDLVDYRPVLSEGERLAGWYDASDATQTAKTIDELNAELHASTVTEGEKVVLKAKLIETRTVTFSNRNDVVENTFTVDYGTDFQVLENYVPLHSNEKFNAWQVSGGGAIYPVNSTITNVTEDIALVPIVVEGHWLRFAENDGAGGASYAAPVLLAPGVPYTTLPDASFMKRPGYTFAGWYRSTDCTIDANGIATANSGASPVTSISITEDTTVYAMWTPATVRYHINVWWQSIDDKTDTNPKHYRFISHSDGSEYDGSEYFEVAALTTLNVTNNDSSVTITDGTHSKTINVPFGFDFGSVVINNPSEYTTDKVSGLGNT